MVITRDLITGTKKIYSNNVSSVHWLVGEVYTPIIPSTNQCTDATLFGYFLVLSLIEDVIIPSG